MAVPLSGNSARRDDYKIKNVVNVKLERKKEDVAAPVPRAEKKEESEKIKNLREVYGNAARKDGK